MRLAMILGLTSYFNEYLKPQPKAGRSFKIDHPILKAAFSVAGLQQFWFNFSLPASTVL